MVTPAHGHSSPAPRAPDSLRVRRAARTQRVRGRIAFFREFVKAPHVMAAVAPSSRRLANRMLQDLDFSTKNVVVEYGPGTGTFTRAVLDSLPPGWLRAENAGGTGRFIAVEFNRPMAVSLRRAFPAVTVKNDDAANIAAICAAEGIPPGEVDVVISGLGWPSFNDQTRTRILEATAQVLRPGGEFRTFGYHVGLLMRGAWHFRREVRRLFSEVEISRVVWRNAPPAFVYRCRK
ncbi:MAG: methyltransferase domain-containing protein [Phycisphaeraceae bacterium]|nr:methyltransferase domain-containing protein [Phycisphaeraceae bacterium]